MTKDFTADEVHISHSDVVRLRNEGKLRLGISRSAADQISSSRDLQPRKTTAGAAFKFWIVVALLAFLYSIYLSFTSHWWWFLVGLVVLTVIVRSNSTANQANLLDAAMVDERFYDKVAELAGWLYRMNEEDAEPFFTEDCRLGQDALQRFQAGL
jgi:hypothetical protein